MLINKIRKLQSLACLLLLFQLAFKHSWIPFHFLACIVSILVLWHQRHFKVICIKYNYWIIGLYFFYILIIAGLFDWAIFYWIYFTLSFYTCIMGLLISLRTLL